MDEKQNTLSIKKKLTMMKEWFNKYWTALVSQLQWWRYELKSGEEGCKYSKIEHSIFISSHQHFLSPSPPTYP